MKLVKTLTNKNLASEFSKKIKIKNASNFLISLFQIQTQTVSNAQYQISNDHSKKKNVKHTEKEMNLISLMNMLNKISDQVNKIISVRQILKFNKMNLI